MLGLFNNENNVSLTLTLKSTWAHLARSETYAVENYSSNIVRLITYTYLLLRMTNICTRYRLTWSRLAHIRVGKLNFIIGTNDGKLLIRTLGTHFCEILSGIHIVSFTKMHLKMSSAKLRHFCLGLKVSRYQCDGLLLCYSQWIQIILYHTSHEIISEIIFISQIVIFEYYNSSW